MGKILHQQQTAAQPIEKKQENMRIMAAVLIAFIL
jgi:hypothetical protein